jgi:hypothetical protein
MTPREPLPADILAAMDGGELTPDQLRHLIAWEAEQIGLTYRQATTAARDGTLPKTALGMDIDLLVRMLDDGEDR